jgi:L-serine deaminase
MEYLIRNLIEQLIIKKELELNYIEKYKNDELNDLILISSGKIFELDAVIQKLKDLLVYYNTTK